MFGLAARAIATAEGSGASFADIRVVETRRQELRVKNGEAAAPADRTTLGYGVRVLWKGSWGFASGETLTGRAVAETALKALAIARAGRPLAAGRARLAPEPAYADVWRTPFLKDPFLLPAGEKLGVLLRADEAMRKNRKVRLTSSEMRFSRERQWHLTTDGSRIEQELLHSGAFISATALENGEAQLRSYPCLHGGRTFSGGWETIEALGLEEQAERVGDEAAALLGAPACPEGVKDLLISGNQLAMQIHESVGHAVELDRALGYEESYAGSTFATPEKLGRFRYGSPLVNLAADATLPGGLATAGYDDDAVKAQRWHIVKDGLFAGYLTNRELCCRAGERRSRGCCRADGYAHVPITRICNLSLLPGSSSTAELIAGIKDGVLMENNLSWSIDQKRLNFQFGCEAGWLIRNGRKGRLVKNPSYQGITPAFWRSCDGIAGQGEWSLWSVSSCGKGQPTQTAMMSHGSSPARFRNVAIGVHG